MKARISAALSGLALALALAPLSVSAAARPTQTYDLVTHETDAISPGEIEGRLHISISPDGIVYGTFIDSQGRIQSVSGGLEGTKIWLQIGQNIIHNSFTGTLIDGVLTAKAPVTGLHEWTLRGEPAKH